MGKINTAYGPIYPEEGGTLGGMQVHHPQGLRQKQQTWARAGGGTRSDPFGLANQYSKNAFGNKNFRTSFDLTVPDRVGRSTNPHYNTQPVVDFIDLVPHSLYDLTNKDVLEVGITATHPNGIAKVEFGINRFFKTVYEKAVNPRTGEEEFWLQIPKSKVSNNTYAFQNIRVGVYPATAGAPVIVETQVHILPGGPPGACITTTNSQDQITDNNITWNLDQEYEVGQFVNGEYFVVAPNGCTVLTVSPAKFTHADGIKNGSMVNPEANSPAEQGFGSVNNQAKSYFPTLSVTYPVDLNPGDSLISTEYNVGSNGSYSIYEDVSCDKPTYGYIKNCAVLTILAEAPPCDTFRPPYAGTVKPLYNLAQVNTAVLPKLLPPGYIANPGVYDYDDVAVNSCGRNLGQTICAQFGDQFKRVWAGLTVNDFAGRYFHPTENMAGYHEEIYTIIDEAMAVIISDPETVKPANDLLNDLLVPFIQCGIDMHYAILSGENRADSSVHKGMILLTGLLLQEPVDFTTTYGGFRTDFMTYKAVNKECKETSQHVPAGQGWTGATVLWRQDPPLFNQSEHETLHPFLPLPTTEWLSKVNQGGIKREFYRRLNSRKWVGMMLALLKCGLKPAVKHDEFFDYVDRWMTEPDVQNHADLTNFYNYKNSNGSSKLTQGQTCASDFVKQMYLTYRN